MKRHGVEPVAAVSQLEPLLIALGDRSGMVPRDTVHHYGRWNPDGSRCRSYTGTREEFVLIASVRTSLPRLASALDVCQRLAGEYRTGVLRAGARPYYEDIRVAGVRYLGPSGSHLPLALIDLVLWACDQDDHELNRPALRRHALKAPATRVPSPRQRPSAGRSARW